MRNAIAYIPHAVDTAIRRAAHGPQRLPRCAGHVNELGPQLDGQGSGRVAHGMDTTADTIARLDDGDRHTAAGEVPCGRQACNTGTHDDDMTVQVILLALVAGSPVPTG